MIVFILANSADTNEMLPYAAFHLGLHCLMVSRMKRANYNKKQNLEPCSV